MNRLFIIFIGLSMLLVASVASQNIAKAQTTLSEGHVERIRQNCVAAQASLYRLHANDALRRVNLGPLYENISTKLMAPLNSRIALSRQEGLKLAATTLEYDRNIDLFRSSYNDYEKAMSGTLEMNCAENPVEFYERVSSTRQKRQRLYEDTQTLATLLNAYKAEFEAFASGLEGSQQ